MSQRRGGIIQVKANGQIFDAKGHFTYSLGGRKRTAVLGSDGRVHGYKEETIVPYIEGAITDRGVNQATSLDLRALQTMEDATITLEVANGKVVVLREAWYALEGEANTEEGEVKVRWEGTGAMEVT